MLNCAPPPFANAKRYIKHYYYINFVRFCQGNGSAIISLMGLNYKLIKRFSKTSTSDVAHSSEYANAQNNNNFGATTSESFEQRREIDENRQIVQGYRQSMVAQQVNTTPRAKTYQEQMAEEAARKAALRAKYAKDKEAFDDRRKSFYANREAGGLNELQRQRLSNVYATGSAARQQAQQQMNARQEMAKRFEANARPAPKTGGFGKY